MERVLLLQTISAYTQFDSCISWTSCNSVASCESLTSRKPGLGDRPDAGV